MKKITLHLLFLIFILSCKGQTSVSTIGSEFGTENNGLMYPDSTMKALRHMVDSLNIRFKSCRSNPSYISRPQGKVWRVTFSSPTNDLKDIEKDIKRNPDFFSMINKYKSLISQFDTSNVLIKFTNYNTDEDEEKVYYLLGKPSDGYDEDYVSSDNKNSRRVGKWIINYSAKDEYDSLNELECRYLPEEFKQTKIPQEYADYIAYVDCMIDTNSVIFLSDRSNSIRFSSQKIAELGELIAYLDRKMKLKPARNKADYRYEYISEEQCKYARENLKYDVEFNDLLLSVANACIENSTGSDSLEDLVSEFISPAKSLEIKRHRRVMGMCSQDQSPRFHARNIAMLAAETNSWDIFLRAHMDIMNDRFDRMSDGSYAWGRRKTYLGELETLNLNIVDLMIGLSLRAENTAQNHYNGTIWRLGWALSESKDAALFEAKSIQMMKDNRLDDFNQGLIFLLYRTYLGYLPDIKTANGKINAIKEEAGSFPPLIASAIIKLKERTARKED